MSAIEAAPATAIRPAARIAGSHGYRIDGDVARINARIEAAGELPAGADWALQLWACDQPFAGGRIAGTKVAELHIAAPGSGDHPGTVDGAVPARLPAGAAPHAMTLVLASGSDGRFDLIHDYANYPLLERFVLPRLGGSVGYRFAGSQVELSAEVIENPREHGNVSGTLALELRAAAAAGRAGEGMRLAGAVAGTVDGQSELRNVAMMADAGAIPEGSWQLIVALCEWTAGGYATRDFRVMPELYVVPPPAPEPSVATLAPEPFVAAPALEPFVATPAPQRFVGTSASHPPRAAGRAPTLLARLLAKLRGRTSP